MGERRAPWPTLLWLPGSPLSNAELPISPGFFPVTTTRMRYSGAGHPGSAVRAQPRQGGNDLAGLQTVPPPAAPIQPAPIPVDVAVVPTPVRELPLTLFVSAPIPIARPVAPFGRLISCETVVTLESNRLDTPVIGLVTEDVWHNGRRVIPAGAEVHGRAALDRTRERLGAQGTWRIVWRTTDRDNGEELAVEGLALDCDLEPESHRRG